MKVAWGSPLSTGPRTWLLCTPSALLPRANNEVCFSAPGTRPVSFLHRDDPQLKWRECGDMVRPWGVSRAPVQAHRKERWGMGRAKLGMRVSVATPK